MPGIIAILEDDPRRTEAMKEVLKEVAAEYEHRFFDNAPEMIAWLDEHLREVTLLSLDHDLGANRLQNGKDFDPGTGRDVADFLATRAACPTIIHSNNYPAVLAMCRVLQDGGWRLSCVVPYDDVEWIADAWAKQIHKALRPGI
jgi:hypothetical protein